MLPMMMWAAVGQGKPAEVRQRQFLENRYAELNACVKTRSIPKIHSWIFSNASRDFFMRPSGSSLLSAAETVSMMKDEFLILKVVKSSTMKLGNFSFHPDRMSCSVKSHLDALTKDNRHVVSDGLSVNTWRLVGKSWKLASAVTTRQQTKINGKLVQP